MVVVICYVTCGIVHHLARDAGEGIPDRWSTSVLINGALDLI
jgi:hypothetical protein